LPSIKAQLKKGMTTHDLCDLLIMPEEFVLMMKDESMEIVKQIGLVSGLPWVIAVSNRPHALL
jgi:hypothetical protein